MLTPDQILTAIDAIPPFGENGERQYLGASEIGNECSRYLWLKFHKYITPEVFEPRMHRLFHRGHDQEGYFEYYLRELGFEIIENCYSQVRFKDGFFSGAPDGIVSKDGVKYVCEYKTHSLKSFDKLKLGDLEKDFPKHFAQMQINGSKFGCSHAIYLAVCKNDDRLFCDVIEIDLTKVKAIEDKAECISMADKPPERIATKSTAFACKFCHAKNVCWGFEMPRVNCKNCTSVEKNRSDGTWSCDSHKQLDVRGSCEAHSWNPHAMNDLLQWSPIEFHPKQRAVEYKLPDGSILINGKSPFGIGSKDLKI